MRNLTFELGKIGTVRQFHIKTNHEGVRTPAMMRNEDNSIVFFEGYPPQEYPSLQVDKQKIFHFPHFLPDFNERAVAKRVKELTKDLTQQLVSVSYYSSPCVYQPLTKKNVNLLFIKDIGKIGYEDLISFIANLREIFPIDTALALLSPLDEELIPFLVNMGIDLVNIDPYLLKAWKENVQKSLLQNPLFGWNIQAREKLKGKTYEETAHKIQESNKQYLTHLFSTLRWFTSQGMFRKFLETWSHRTHRTDEVLTVLDKRKKEFFNRYLSLRKDEVHDFIGAESLRRPIVSFYRKKITENYVPPEVEVVLFLPCSARKPYSDSPSHKQFLKAIRSGTGSARCKIHEVMVTSPFGIIPRELEATPPAVNYEITVTGHWSEREINYTEDLVKEYIQKQRKQTEDLKIIVHLEGGYLKAVRRALEKQGIEYTLTAKGHPRHQSSLHSLKDALKGAVVKGVEQEEWVHKSAEKVRAFLSYQFTPKIARELTRDRKAVGKPRTKRWRIPQVVTFDPTTGFFLPQLKGGEILSQFNKWIAKLRKKPQERVLKGSLIKEVKGDIHIGEIFVGSMDGPILVGQALVPGMKMKSAENVKVARILHTFST